MYYPWVYHFRTSNLQGFTSGRLEAFTVATEARAFLDGGERSDQRPAVSYTIVPPYLDSCVQWRGFQTLLLEKTPGYRHLFLS